MVACREKAINDAQQMMAMQQSMGGMGGPMGFDAEKAFAAERAQLNMVRERAFVGEVRGAGGAAGCVVVLAAACCYAAHG
jgi:hypothetical protein